MLGNYLQQTISADDICRCIFFLGALRGRVYDQEGLHIVVVGNLPRDPVMTSFTFFLYTLSFWTKKLNIYIFLLHVDTQSYHLDIICKCVNRVNKLTM